MNCARMPLLGILALALLAGLCPWHVPVAPALAESGATTLVSVPNLADQGTLGTQANSYSFTQDISTDGRYVAFQSNASNLVVGDVNGNEDIFVHDTATGTTQRVSVSTGGDAANGYSYYARISGDGRYVAFTSEATNLVPGDSNSSADVFVRDLDTGATERVSVDSAGAQANDDSVIADMTPDGRFIVFTSWASNLVPGDTHVCQGYFEFEIIYYNCSDVFINDRQTGVTERLSLSSSGQQSTGNSGSGSISDDGRFVVFFGGEGIPPGGAAGTVIRDRALGTTTGMALADSPVISGDGGSVVFGTQDTLIPDDTNGWVRDSYVYTRAPAIYERASLDSGGNQGDGDSMWSDISANGRFVTFSSKSSNLVPDDTNHCSVPSCDDIFLRDRVTGTTQRVSLDSLGTQADSASVVPQISDDGRFVTFRSWASNLVPSDTNGWSDVFVHEVSFPDADGDSITDEADNCPLASNVSQADGDTDGVGTACDNCPDTPNPTQTNTDGDTWGDACDSDDDNDLVSDVDEPPCGSDPLDVSPPLSRPERVDLPGDDDGDTLVDEPLPVGAESYDCDGDGYTGTVEAHVFSDTNVRDQDPCGTTSSPADFVSGGIPNSTDKVTVTDLTSFLAPTRHINTNPVTAADFRWDVTPGPGLFANVINIADLTSLITVSPPMFSNARAYRGPTCPWP